MVLMTYISKVIVHIQNIMSLPFHTSEQKLRSSKYEKDHISGQKQRAKRELSHPSFFGFYRRFWRGCKWEVFLQPHPAGFPLACRRPHVHEGVKGLRLVPGVYEFAISKSSGPFHTLGQKQKYKVYVGESGSMRKRHQTYAKTGDHLILQLDKALRDECTVWRRCRYVKSKKKAVKKEAKLLKKYDFSWNAQQNGRKRDVGIVSSHFCMCMSSMSIREHAQSEMLLFVKTQFIYIEYFLPLILFALKYLCSKYEE